MKIHLYPFTHCPRTRRTAAALGLFAGMSGCGDSKPLPSQLAANTPLRCTGPSCVQLQTPLPNSVDQHMTWDPCQGKPFTFALNANFERNKDFISVGGRVFTGALNAISGQAAGPVSLHLQTNAAIPSTGITSLLATCLEGAGTTTAPTTGLTAPTTGETSSAGLSSSTSTSAPGTSSQTPKATLICDDLQCRTTNPVGHNLNETATWNPCQGGPFFFEGRASFEKDQDTLTIDKLVVTGEHQDINGYAPGPIQVQLRTNASVHSKGITALMARCDHTGTGSEPGDPSKPTLVCRAKACETPQKPVPNNVDATVDWNPCGGYPFSYSGRINLEAGQDFLEIAGTRFTGATRIAGDVAGPGKVRLMTNASNPSIGIISLDATCKSIPSGTTTTGGSTSGGSTSTSSTSTSTSTGDTTNTEEPKPELSCAGLSCTSRPSPLPAGLRLTQDWNPCNGKPFSVNGSVALNANPGQANRDLLQIGQLTFTGNRPVQATLPGPVTVTLSTTQAGATPSSGIQSLNANCSVEQFGLVCQDTRCETKGTLLPGSLNQETRWDPCNGRGFTWKGVIDLEANQDFLNINGTDYSGLRTEISGASQGAATLRLRTSIVGDSRGVDRLEATCSQDPGTNPNFPGLLMTDWNADQVKRYNETVKAFLAAQGIDFLNEHSAWHKNNDTGTTDEEGNNGISGNKGPGSGMAFVGMHRAMLNAFQRFARARPGGVLARPINIDAALPAGLIDAKDVRAGVPGAKESWYSRRNKNSYAGSGLEIPDYFMLKKSKPGNEFRLKSGKTVRSLDDFANPDEIGEVMGRSGYHGKGHWWIGGTLGTVHSPLDPIFWGWHKLLDDIFQNWLDNTKAGVRWARQNPSHPILSRRSENTAHWKNEDTAFRLGGI